MTDATASATVWANVCRVLEEAGHGTAPSIDTVLKVIKKKVGRGQLQRLAEGGNVTLKTVERLAGALGVPTWRLLQPYGPQVNDPGSTYAVTSNSGLVDAVEELIARLPREHRTPAADLIGAWLRSGEDEGRSAALLALFGSKQRNAA